MSKITARRRRKVFVPFWILLLFCAALPSNVIVETTSLNGTSPPCRRGLAHQAVNVDAILPLASRGFNAREHVLLPHVPGWSGRHLRFHSRVACGADLSDHPLFSSHT